MRTHRTCTLAVPVVLALSAASCASNQTTSTTAADVATTQRTFATPEEAASALVDAASRWDLPALRQLLGPAGRNLVESADAVQDRHRGAKFAAMAREKSSVQRAPKSHVATLVVGADDWPLPIPLVESGGRWRFDTSAGRDEMLRRRIGQNELDVLAICRGYVEAQEEYASAVHDATGVREYARRILSTPGRHDGLAWRNPDGSWGGPIGERAAKALAEGYSRGAPYHGYYFKTLMGQGPAARFGTMDYVVGGAMIGGFALVAWPAEYGVTGVQTFMVSYDGVVYQKDLGPRTDDLAPEIVRYDPDATWTRTDDAW